jgi:very-short-patch-repair endonuclease
MPDNTFDRFRKASARRMRRNATAAEAKLWRALRRHPIVGSHFRRQVIVGPYIADFACMAARLIVEVDGSQHAEGPTATSDKTRTTWFEREGYKVLRFWNNDVFANIDGVIAAIRTALAHETEEQIVLKHFRRSRADHPTPASFARRPSPSRGG